MRPNKGVRHRAALLTLLLFLSACDGDEARTAFEMERIPDDQGMVTQVDSTQVVLDEERRYAINPQVESFSTYNGHVTALRSWNEMYVHIGLNSDDEAIWIAGIGVVDDSKDPPETIYTNGLVKRVEDGRIFFGDGTVLRLGDGVDVPDQGWRVTVTIDVNRDEVVDLAQIS